MIYFCWWFLQNLYLLHILFSFLVWTVASGLETSACLSPGPWFLLVWHHSILTSASASRSAAHVPCLFWPWQKSQSNDLCNLMEQSNGCWEQHVICDRRPNLTLWICWLFFFFFFSPEERWLTLHLNAVLKRRQSKLRSLLLITFHQWFSSVPFDFYAASQKINNNKKKKSVSILNTCWFKAGCGSAVFDLLSLWLLYWGFRDHVWNAVCSINTCHKQTRCAFNLFLLH